MSEEEKKYQNSLELCRTKDKTITGQKAKSKRPTDVSDKKKKKWEELKRYASKTSKFKIALTGSKSKLFSAEHESLETWLLY